MYEIYINDTPLFLEPFENYNPGGPLDLSAVYMGKPVTLLQYVDSLEKANKLDSIHVYAHDLQALWEDFRSLYKILDAAGGLVENEEGEMLAIFRRGHWDMAKGKTEKGETLAETALREVAEETGLTDIRLGEALSTTYHTYLNRKGKRVLKQSHWFRMSAPKQPLSPQEEEDIEKAVWIHPQDFLSECEPMYSNIRNVVLEAYGEGGR